MKNVIVSHNELQLNLFHAVTYGLQNHDFGPGLFLVSDITEREYVWKVMKHTKREGAAVAGQTVFYGYINKGDFQMNDMRLGVTVCYIRDEAEKFLKNFQEYQNANYAPKTQEEVDTIERIAGNQQSAEHLLFTNWHTSKEIPEVDTKEEDLTEYVLIDPDGYRTDFTIGYYNTGSKEWVSREGKSIDVDHMKWTELPLDK
jgi:hypothetical protein